MEGQSPLAILDGTQIAGFTLPTDEQGFVDETRSSDPYHCVIPYDQMPISINPPLGVVVTANNDPQGFSDDGRVENDAWYLGGPWSPFRAHTITRSLTNASDIGPITVEEMERTQANSDSRLGELFTTAFIESIDRAETWSEEGANLNESQSRVAELLNNHRILILQAREYLQKWRDNGYQARSGVETFYNPQVDEREREDAIATMIFNSSIRILLEAVWSDERVDSIPYDGTRLKVYALDRILRGRGEDNPLNLISWDAERQESIFFDHLNTPEVIETSDELLVSSLTQAIEQLTAPPSGAGEGGFGTEDMTQWLWGMRHQARFESILGPFLGNSGAIGALLNQFSITTTKIPLASSLSADDPRKDLKHFPRPGDQWGVDAGNPGFGGGFTHGNGPVMRMVISLNGDEVSGRNIVPGGQSGILNSSYFSDQLKLWLANDTLPVRFHLSQVLEGAETRWRFEPESSSP